MGARSGLIAATAVASADSLTALIPLAIESVRVAFRVGEYVDRMAANFDCEGASRSWSTFVATNSKSVQAALDKFHAENDIAPANQMWISSTLDALVTVSGPPSMKSRLFESSEFFKPYETGTLPIYAPYHAPHLTSLVELEHILGPQINSVFDSASVRHSVCSGSTGKPFDVKNGFELLKACVKETLVEPLRWDKIVKFCTPPQLAETTVFTFGPTDISASIVTAFEALGTRVILRDQSYWAAVNGAASSPDRQHADIAIVGMSGRFPDAPDHETLWKLLEQGVDAHRLIPSDRFPIDSHTDPTLRKRNTSHTAYGNFIEKPGYFDARFFNMSPREAAQTDPMQRLLLTTSYEAMEMAGIVPGRTPSTQNERIGTFYGQGSDDWREVNAAQDIDTYFIPGGVRGFGPGRINYFFKFSGPSYSVDTACSSSFAAMNVAVTSLRAGECDTAFTGGTSVLTNSDTYAGLSRGYFLSKSGSCKTWDDDADGYCRGEGVCTVILKRIEDAVADQDPILGVIRGIATNHCAQAISITHPCVENQSFLFRKILNDCNVSGTDVDYVEMHGTGTQAGDSIEMESVSSVFAPRIPRRRADQPLYIGALKPNIGHGEAVSGVQSLIKVLLMFQKSKIPPHIGIKRTMNKKFAPDLKERGLNIAFDTTPFPRPPGRKRTVFINNFGASGGNTGVLLEDGPERRHRAPSTDIRSTQVVTVSAKSLASFQKNVARLQSFLTGNPDISLPDLAYTTNARRSHYAYRMALPVTSLPQLTSALKSLEENEVHNPVSWTEPQVAFMFTGQGSQYTDMGKQLYETCPQFKSNIDEFNKVAIHQHLPSFLPLIKGSRDIEELPPTVVQLGMCCIQMALRRLWSTWGVNPSVVIGHSLGEYAALEAAGVLSVADTIYLVGMRAALLEKECTPWTHAMLAVRSSDASALQDFITSSQEKVEIACINSVQDTVLSGPIDDINVVAEKLAHSGQKCTKLKLPFAFHSSQVNQILGEFEKLASAVLYHPPRIPVISPLLRNVVRDSKVINANYLSRHCRLPVDIVGSLSKAITTATVSNKFVWLEIGTHPLCTNMIRSPLPSAPIFPVMRKGEEIWKTISVSLAGLYNAGVSINWHTLYKENKSLQVVNLPAYGFDEKNYWIQYTGDWLIHKGQYPMAVAKKSLSTSVQSIISEMRDGSIATVVAETDLADPKLFAVVAGHLVNGSAICPPSLYTDMAYTLCHYALNLFKSDEKFDLNFGSMYKPTQLILKTPHQPQSHIIRQEIKADLAAKKAEFTVTADNGVKSIVYARCEIKLENADAWREEWAKIIPQIKSHINQLKSKLRNGDADMYGRATAYKLAAVLVDYSDTFQGMQNVIHDGPQFEATSHIKFRAGPQDGNFHLNPFLTDSAFHLGAFTLNATISPGEGCYVLNTWSNLRVLAPFQYDKQYHAYVKMHPEADSKTVIGDVYVLSENKDEIVGHGSNYSFKRVTNSYMDASLPKKKATENQKSTDIVPVPRQKKELSSSDAAVGSLVTNALNIIAQELGVLPLELNDIAAQWTELGVDSLMSLEISAKLRENLHLDVDITLFVDHPSVGDLRRYLSRISGSDTFVTIPVSTTGVGLADPSSSESESNESPQNSEATTPDPQGSTLQLEVSKSAPSPETTRDMQAVVSIIPSPTTVAGIIQSKLSAATSTLLQGNPKTASRKLFLFPDVCGSAATYGAIPTINSKDLAVYGLNGDFKRLSKCADFDIENVSALFLQEVLRRQPTGPYYLGGWSTGGVIAYEVTRQLAELTKTNPHPDWWVSQLILIDSPCPIGLEDLPRKMNDLLGNGFLLKVDSGKAPSDLLPRLKCNVKALAAYRPELEQDRPRPPTLLIWGSDGLYAKPSSVQPLQLADSHGEKWLRGDRSNLGLNGWERLIGRSRVIGVDGAHFSMMNLPTVSLVHY